MRRLDYQLREVDIVLINMPSGIYKRIRPPWNKGTKGISVGCPKGKVFTDEHKEKLRQAKLGKVGPWAGKKRPEVAEWIRKANTGRKHTEEWKKNNGERMKGRGNWRWIEDRSKIKIGERFMNDPLQKGWRKAVKNRDGWKCRIADNNCAGRLEAHHILPWKDFPELRHEINNGITLCHAHHPKKRDDVTKLSPYFQALVASLD